MKLYLNNWYVTIPTFRVQNLISQKEFEHSEFKNSYLDTSKLRLGRNFQNGE